VPLDDKETIATVVRRGDVDRVGKPICQLDEPKLGPG
jgi:hypothetical protein